MDDRSVTVPTTSACENRTRRGLSVLCVSFKTAFGAASEIFIAFSGEGETVAGDRCDVEYIEINFGFWHIVC